MAAGTFSHFWYVGLGMLALMVGVLRRLGLLPERRRRSLAERFSAGRAATAELNRWLTEVRRYVRQQRRYGEPERLRRRQSHRPLRGGQPARGRLARLRPASDHRGTLGRPRR